MFEFSRRLVKYSNILLMPGCIVVVVMLLGLTMAFDTPRHGALSRLVPDSGTPHIAYCRIVEEFLGSTGVCDTPCIAREEFSDVVRSIPVSEYFDIAATFRQQHVTHQSSSACSDCGFGSSIVEYVSENLEEFQRQAKNDHSDHVHASDVYSNHD